MTLPPTPNGPSNARAQCKVHTTSAYFRPETEARQQRRNHHPCFARGEHNGMRAKARTPWHAAAVFWVFRTKHSSPKIATVQIPPCNTFLICEAPADQDPASQTAAYRVRCVTNSVQEATPSVCRWCPRWCTRCWSRHPPFPRCSPPVSPIDGQVPRSIYGVGFGFVLRLVGSRPVRCGSRTAGAAQAAAGKEPTTSRRHAKSRFEGRVRGSTT